MANRSKRAEVYARDGGRCLRCGTDDGLTLDHIVPGSLGGTDCVNNLQTLCRPCNGAKGTAIVDYRDPAAL